jgi:hypothetical protein
MTYCDKTFSTIFASYMKLHVVIAVVLLCGYQQTSVAQQLSESNKKIQQSVTLPDTPAKEPATGNPNSSANNPSGKTATRVTFGLITFIPPEGWRTREMPTDDKVIYSAPNSEKWQKYGLGPVLIVQKRPHPRVSLERFKDVLDQGFSQSAKEANEFINQRKYDTKEWMSMDAKTDKPRYTLAIQHRDGTRFLSSTCQAVLRLSTRKIVTKTCSIVVLSSDIMYSIAMTFPQEVEKELDPIWQSFEKSVQFGKE